MKEFFINALEKIIGVIVIIMMIAVIIGFFATAFGAGGQNGGILGALFVLVVGALYVVLFGGMMYLGLGIYHNTKRTAEAVEHLAEKP